MATKATKKKPAKKAEKPKAKAPKVEAEKPKPVENPGGYAFPQPGYH